MISQVAIMTGIANDSPLGLVNGIIVLLLILTGIKAIFLSFSYFARWFR